MIAIFLYIFFSVTLRGLFSVSIGDNIHTNIIQTKATKEINEWNLKYSTLHNSDLINANIINVAIIEKR